MLGFDGLEGGPARSGHRNPEPTTPRPVTDPSVTVTRHETSRGATRMQAAAAALASNALNSNLRRAQLSFLAAWTAEWAFTVALRIIAYRDGGATAVGLVGLLRMVPSAVVAPLAAPLADRGRRERVLVLCQQSAPLLQERQR